MKCYKHRNPVFSSFIPSESEEIKQPAKMLGSCIVDGRYNGVSDGAAGLLVGQYDNDSSMCVDPLCDFSTDLAQLRPNSSVPTSSPPSE